MTKKIFILIAVAIILVLVGFWVFSNLKKENTSGTESGETNFFSEFFPFGKNKTNNNQNSTPPSDISGYLPPTENQNEERLTKISSVPVAGYAVFPKERYKEEVVSLAEGNPTPPEIEIVSALRYVDRATGNIYQTFVDKIEERKFTTTTIPQVYEAYFGNEGESVVLRYLKEDNKTIESYLGILPKEILGGDIVSSGELVGSFLPENVTDISISPSALSFFYIFNSGENAIGTIANASGERKNQIFSSPFTEWLTNWPNERMITLNTKPSFNVPGFIYALDPSTKKITKLLDNINGLTTLASPSGKLILYGNNNLSLAIYNIDTEDETPLGIKTLPEKCVWSEMTSGLLFCAVPKYIFGTNYPDTWYQGEISFSDEIWKIDTNTGSTTILADPLVFSRGEEIDAIKMSLDESEQYLFLVNKKDSSLWKFQLN